MKYPNIKAEMARNGKTLTLMTQVLKMSANSFRFKLSGKREFTLKELEIMADLFNCSIDYLVGRERA